MIILVTLIFSAFAGIYIKKLINPDFSKYIKNEKLKTYLHDNYWFNKNKKLLLKENLFLICGSKTNESFEKITKEHANVILSENFSQSNKAFEIYDQGSCSYVFIHEDLLKNDNLIKNNLRLKLFIDKITKLRRNKLIDGILFFPAEIVFKNSLVPRETLINEAQTFSLIHQTISQKLNFLLPILFIQNLDSFELETHFEIPQNDKELQTLKFGFYHEIQEKNKAIEVEIKKAIEASVDAFEFKMRSLLQKTSSDSQRDIISYFFKLKSSLFNFSRNYVHLFYENINSKDNNININAILSARSFYNKEEDNYYLKNMFRYLSKNFANKAKLSQEGISNKYKKNVVTGTILVLSTLAYLTTIISSNNFLSEKKQVLIQSFTQLSSYKDEFGGAKLQNNTYNESLALQVCTLIDELQVLQKNSFQYALLFPSWNSNFNTEISVKYQAELTKFLSTYLVKHFNEKVENSLHNYKIDLTKGEDSALEQIKLYINDEENISKIYHSLSLNDKNENLNALNHMVKFLYGANCGKDVLNKTIFSNININTILSKLKLNSTQFKDASITSFNNLVGDYLQILSSQNNILSTAQALATDLSKENLMTAPYYASNSFSNIEKISSEYNLLNKELLKNGNMFQSLESFYGVKFASLLKQRTSIKILSQDAEINFSLLAESVFSKFKEKLNSISPSGYYFPILTMNESSNGIYQINPLISQLVQALDKMQSYYKSESLPVNNFEMPQYFSADLSFIAKNLPQNATWSINYLQSALQKGILFTNVYSSVNQNQYPMELVSFFKETANSMSYYYWLENLPKSIQILNTMQSSLFSDPQNIDPLTQNIILAAPILNTVSSQLTTFNQNKINSDMLSILKQQINKQIEKHLQELSNSSLFKSVYEDFSWWDGMNSPAYRAFGVANDDELKLYISEKSEELKLFFTQKIQPLLNARELVFKEDLLHSTLSSKKDDPIDFLKNSIDSTKTNTSFANISHFILEIMNPLRTEICPNFLDKDFGILNKNDLFSLRQSTLQSMLTKRCEELYLAKAISNYNKFANEFNNHVAGKFPFQDHDYKNESVSLENLTSIMAEFIQLQQKDIPFLNKYSSLYRSRSNVQIFVSSFSLLKEFFQTEANKEGNPSPVQWNVEYRFRSNTDNEILANQIIDWSLQSGNTVIGSKFGDISRGKFTWVYPDPIRFSITIANSSKYILDKIKPDKNIFVTNNTIYFNVRNPWSILKFVQDYSTCDGANSCLNNDLKFEIPLKDNKTIVFYSSIFIKNQKGKTIKIPSFPKHAPLLETKYVEKLSDNFD